GDDHVVGVGRPPGGGRADPRPVHRPEADRGGRAQPAGQDGPVGRGVRRPDRGGDPEPVRVRRGGRGAARETEGGGGGAGQNQLLASRLGYWVRPGNHAMTPADWKTYMDFADKWLK